MVLEKYNSGAKFLHIMYRANLSYTLTKKYLDKLMKEELIIQKDELYFLTEKGLRLLDILKAYIQKKEELDELEQQILELYGE